MLEKPMKEFHILSLGAGVQSTMLALMSHQRISPSHVPLFDAAIFADTQEEPDEVYQHLEWLQNEVASSFPVITRSAGSLGNDLLNGMGESNRFISIPAYTAMTEGEPIGIVKRQCSLTYKVDVVERAIRMDILKLRKGQRKPKNIVIHQYLGLSAEEGYRIYGRGNRPGAKDRVESRGSIAHFPLYDLLLKRSQIEDWLAEHVPHRTPRSACSFCPYHSNEEWSRIKNTDPESWRRACEIDRGLRDPNMRGAREFEQLMYVHKSCVPLEDADLSFDINDSQQELNFSLLECEGMCGI